MPEDNPAPVVVAVGHDPVDSALAYAVVEARRRGCGVHLVHAVHHTHDGPDSVFVTESDRERVGRLALTSAMERLEAVADEGMTISSDMVSGSIAAAIATSCADARMIVLEHRDLGRLQRVVTRSVASGVAARAQVPVVSVPSHWSPSHRHAAETTVTVGVDDPARSASLLRTAADAASVGGATLCIVHAWAMPRAYEDLGTSPEDEERWAAQVTTGIQEVLDAIADELEGVTVKIVVRHAPPADALVETSRTSDLLVIGRHDPLLPVGSHLGPVARAVLREAECPVMMAGSRQEA